MAVKNFESGFLVIGTSGTKGKAVLKLTDVSLSYSVDTDEITSFDSSFAKTYQPTYSSWNVSCSGIFADDIAPNPYSGSSTQVTGATNGILLLDQTKLRATCKLILKVDTANFQRGDIIINSYELKGAVGNKMTYTLQLQGTGALTTAAT